jgi:outer membrane biosynthesis protein TonB
MELTYVTIVVLASMIFVLSGMVGYLYWQQTRMLQHLQSLAMVVANQVSEMQQQVEEAEEEEAPEVAPEPEKKADQEPEPDVSPVEEEEDDRLSVEEVEGPESKESTPSLDIDDLQTKTVVQLREILTQRGIPFGKRDSKTILLQLLKATA